MPESKPTIRTAAWSMAHFHDAAIELLDQDRTGRELRLYFYAVTLSGWRRFATSIRQWKRAVAGRTVAAYIGTDHALTDPEALTKMVGDGVGVRLLTNYKGVYHPKVIWLVCPDRSVILSGSNNLTEDGLRNNVEFATVVELARIDAQLQRWHDAIHAASEPASPTLIGSYKSEKERFGAARAKKGVAGTFTWSKRTSRVAAVAPVGRPLGGDGAIPGDLILEVMPRETSEEGRQVQIPMAAAGQFFGLGPNLRDFVQLTLRNVATTESRSLRLTHNTNSTARLSIRELEYRSRPCVLLFRRVSPTRFDFELVMRAIDPDRYGSLISRCPQVRPRRRWVQLP